MIRHLLNKNLTLYHPSEAPDGAGGFIVTMTQAGTVRGMVSQPTPEERALAQQFGAILAGVVYVDAGVAVYRGDEIDTGGPRRLRVLSVVQPSRRAYKRLECEVAQGE